MGDDEALGKLLKQYPDEWSAQWAYTTALYTFRPRGEGKAADTALQKALKANPYVPMYLLGAKAPPRHMPGYYGMGDENEAMIYTAEAVRGWLETNGALPWLVASMARALPAALGAARVAVGAEKGVNKG